MIFFLYLTDTNCNSIPTASWTFVS